MTRKFSSKQNAYVMAKANHDAICEIERKCKTKVLNEHVFMTEADENEPSERIINPISDFRMNDEDFTRYCKLVFNEYVANGLKVPDYNTSATYNSFPALKKAENELIEWGFAIIKKLPQWNKFAADIEKLKAMCLLDVNMKKEVINITMEVSC